VAAAVLTEPETAKAAVTAGAPDMIYMSVPIEKAEDTEAVNPVDGTPDLMIWGKVTDGTLDSDLQVVDPQASLKWIERWFADKANVRMGHDPRRPVGRGIERDGHYVKSLIADPTAKHLIRSKVLNDYSIGIMHPDIRRGDPQFKHLDPAGKAVNGVITDRPDGLTCLGEISVVDRGSNFGSAFALVKAAADGTPEWVGKMTGDAGEIAKSAPAKSRTVMVELPKNVAVSFSPKDLAKLVEHRKVAEQREAAKAAAGAPEVVNKAAADDDTPELSAIKAAEAEVWKRDIDTATRRRLASEGKALPNLSYPIENAEDLQNAATLARSGHGDVAGAKRLISHRARELGVPNPLKGAKKKADKAAAATPDVTKCMTCKDSGMAGGRPCPECKKGKRARRAEKAAVREALALVAAPGAEKKSKVLCPGCGARQNRKHAMCSECGKPMAGAMGVDKNHDFTCLGCGKALDKGERHCPGCGKENPGYNPMADHKIPANKAAKPGKERVRKGGKGKRGKKAKSGDGAFGGNQAPPFGAKEGGQDDNGGDGKKPASKKSAKPQAAKRKGKGKGRSPAAGVAGEHDVKGLPAHREPDGAPVEQFEDDARMQDGDERQEMAAAMRHKALAARGLHQSDAILHDLTCPAFSTAALARAFPYESLATVNTDAWQAKALDAAATAELSQAGKAMTLWQHACTLKAADAELVHDLREEAHQAFREANKAALKAFRDAAPGPGSFPAPGHITPQQFRRPYLHEGHAAPSPQQEGPHSFRVPEGQPSAEDYTRGLITAGHAADSPQNDTPRHEPQPAPSTPGRPDRVYYRGTMRDNARQAMTAMHDHIARVFPDVCPMSPELGSTQKPAPPVPEGVGGPAPRRSAKAQKAAARKKAKAMARKRRQLERKVLAGKLSIGKARRRLGLKPVPEEPAAVAKTASAVTLDWALDPEAIKAAVAEATSPLLERVAAQDKALRKLRKTADAIASQPDTSQAPLRGVALNKASAAPAAPQSVAKSAEQAQAAQLQMLHHEWRTNPDPSQREAAWRALTTHLGISPMTTQQT
jgi:hypothetical protein